MRRLFVIKVLVFLAAFLLFQSELTMAKAVLPGFGGSYMVWSVCVMFFQGVLLLGYWYAGLLSRRLREKRVRLFHAAMLILPLCFFPLDLSRIIGPTYRLPAPVEIIWLLARSIGFSFFMLSSVSIVIQNLLAGSDLPARNNPYVLYGTSNLGSFLALISYPVLIEPRLTLDAQLVLFEALYGAAAVIFLYILLAFPGQARMESRAPSDLPPSRLSRRDRLRFGLLSAASCAMFLAVTNVITMDIAAVPFFWVLPISIYLLTFVLNFKRRPFAPAGITGRFYSILPVGIFLFFLSAENLVLPVSIMLPLHLLILFVFCMVCHRELYLGRPQAPRDLSVFYLMLAAGGLAGSVLVSLIIPLLASSPLEYLAGFGLCLLALALPRPLEPAPVRNYVMAAFTAVLVVGWPLTSSLAGPAWSPMVAGVAGTALAVLYFGLGSRPRPIAFSVFLLILISPGLDYFHLDQTLLLKDRNFYGVYRVFDKDGKRFFRHGAAVHGGQYLDPGRQGEALFYYHRSAPAGELLSSGLFSFRDLGIVGLGTGSLAVYAEPGATVDFYELDPEIKAIADRYFTFLAHSRGRLSFFFGDARRSLLQAPDRRYDLLILDAFNSDAIPVHLLTMEAIAEDMQHLNPGGFLLVHVSNRHLDFRPALTATARALHLSVLYKSNEGVAPPDADVSEWMVIGPDRGTAAQLVSRLHWEDLSNGAGVPRVRAWTDRFSDLLSPLLAKNGF